MNEKLVDIMFCLSGLPASAMVGHARLLDDLGFDEKAMMSLMTRINEILNVPIPQQIWRSFTRVADIQDYLKYEANVEKMDFPVEMNKLECV